ncbi:restriction endonuclease [Mesorhizobium amorphae]
MGRYSFHPAQARASSPDPGIGYIGDCCHQRVCRSGDSRQSSPEGDRVYIQAKRYASGNTVGSGAIRDFSGSLDRHKAPRASS